jgi:hypothetical protein
LALTVVPFRPGATERSPASGARLANVHALFTLISITVQAPLLRSCR